MFNEKLENLLARYRSAYNRLARYETWRLDARNFELVICEKSVLREIYSNLHSRMTERECLDWMSQQYRYYRDKHLYNSAHMYDKIMAHIEKLGA